MIIHEPEDFSVAEVADVEKKRINNIVFDLDDTLYSHAALKTDVFSGINEILEIENIRKDEFWEVYKKNEKMLFKAFLGNEINGEDYMFLRYYETLSFLKISDSHDIAEKLKNIYLSRTLCIWDNGNAERILSRIIDMGYSIMLLTNGPVRAQRQKLKALHINELFSGIYISDETGYSKPDSSAFENVLMNEKISIDGTVYVGDSVKFDIEPALALGFKTIFLNNKNENDLYNNNADLISIKELSEIFTALSYFE